ncbi:MAG: S46 family peptidase [Bacteroidales bacterium]|jgi:V8-like Glu-specific endopeptidase|nr:S46 family peptidase [Bacteroidales bacterium]
MKIKFLILVLLPIFLFAEEGMWLPKQLKLIENQLIEKGLVISIDEIYNEDESSLKDAIVKFGSGCTGSFISGEGLLLTNYHCGLDYIQFHSSLQNDYIKNGFWADSMAAELLCPGLKITIQKKMIDVTDSVFLGVSDSLSNEEISQICKENISNILNNARENSHLTVEILSFYGGNCYFLLYNQVFEDVRLVAAPPSRIGQFGEDSDNWVYPRHTGDFSLFRVYTNDSNQPAKYDEKNRPYRPEKHLVISMKGYQEGDMTFVLGFPARTSEYICSAAIQLQTEVENPIIINTRTKRLNIIKEAMANDEKVKIQYTAKYQNIANTWKKLQGVNKGIAKIKVVEKKQESERQFQSWADTAFAGKYARLLPELKQVYQDFEFFDAQYYYFRENIIAPEIVNFAMRFVKLFDEKTTEVQFKNLKIQLEELANDFYENFNIDVDKKLLKNLLVIEKINGKELRFVNFPNKIFPQYVDEMYAKSLFSKKDVLLKELRNLKFHKKNKIAKDPIFNYSETVLLFFTQTVYSNYVQFSQKINNLEKEYMKVQMEYGKKLNNAPIYPDANSTFRFTYGKISGYKASDAVHYDYYTTMDGIIEKYSYGIYDYIPDEKLISLYEKKDFGHYANEKLELPLAFIASNHTTGGNSGSPVFNAEGRLIGLNFDRTWEGTMSDLYFDENQCRNISLDIRFFVFILDKYANAKNLMSEIFPR